MFMDVKRWAAGIIFTVIAGLAVKHFLRYIDIKIFLANVHDTKNGEIQRYGYSKALKILFGFFSCFIIADGVLILYFSRKELPGIFITMEQGELLLIAVCFMAVLFIVYLGFAFLYMGCILTGDTLIIKRLFCIQKIKYEDIKRYAAKCAPVLHKRRLHILLDRKIISIPVIQLQEGLGFTNELMKRCDLNCFEEWEYTAVIFQGENRYEGDYRKMKKRKSNLTCQY